MFESHSKLTGLPAQNRSLWKLYLIMKHTICKVLFSSTVLSLIRMTLKYLNRGLWHLKVRQFWFQGVPYSGMWHHTVWSKSTRNLMEHIASTFTLKMGAVNSFKPSVNFYWITWRCILEYNILHSCCCENCKSNKFWFHFAVIMMKINSSFMHRGENYQTNLHVYWINNSRRKEGI
jgi:hypothetical protein